MDYLFIDRNAKMPRETTVIKETSANRVLLAVINDEIIDLASSYAWCNIRGADVADFRRHLARLAHPVDLGLRLYVDLHRLVVFYIAALKAAAFLSGP